MNIKQHENKLKSQRIEVGLKRTNCFARLRVKSLSVNEKIETEFVRDSLLSYYDMNDVGSTRTEQKLMSLKLIVRTCFAM